MLFAGSSRWGLWLTIAQDLIPIGISHELAQDVHAVLIWDQAGFHKSKRLELPDNITIIPLPAYSPELNPVENLWHYCRSHYWANRAYADYDDLRCAAVEAWQKAALDPDIIKSVCRAEYVERKS